MVFLPDEEDVHIFEANDLITSSVTVFADRAEVGKLIVTKLGQGLNVITVKNLTKSMDSDSIRVNGFGNAVICEVQYKEKYVTKENVEAHSNEKLDELLKTKLLLTQEKQRLEKKKYVLDGMATKVASGTITEKGQRVGLNLISTTDLDDLGKFLNFYDQCAANFDDQLRAIKQKLKILDEEITVMQNNSQNTDIDTNVSREVSIILKAEEPEEAKLILTYHVCNASWTPCYDVRVNKIQNLLQVCYYGLIKQKTGENWKDIQLSLSTATPMIGGQIPEIKTLKVGYYRAMRTRQSVIEDELMQCGLLADNSELCAGFSKKCRAQRSDRMHTSTSVVKIQSEKPSYTMEKPKSEVTIATIDLNPVFQYETIPSKLSFAFLKASIINESKYPFLPGPMAIFLDNTFVAKSDMKSVSPLEKFQCSLGVDPSIKIDCKPIRKFREQTGVISKSSITTYEQQTEIKNTQNGPIKIKMIEQLPMSNNEKIKINLIQPVLNKPEKNCTVHCNDMNNVEFDIIIPNNDIKCISLKYTVEHPKDRLLYFSEE